jgi:hypothetical protein
MADKTPHLTSISPDDLNDLETLLHDLKDKAQQSHDNGATFMHGVYVRLIAIVSPIVIGTHARMEREHLAEQRKLLKASKQTASDNAQPLGRN